jgi:hypothetical protein
MCTQKPRIHKTQTYYKWKKRGYLKMAKGCCVFFIVPLTKFRTLAAAALKASVKIENNSSMHLIRRILQHSRRIRCFRIILDPSTPNAPLHPAPNLDLLSIRFRTTEVKSEKMRCLKRIWPMLEAGRSGCHNHTSTYCQQK